MVLKQIKMDFFVYFLQKLEVKLTMNNSSPKQIKNTSLDSMSASSYLPFWLYCSICKKVCKKNRFRIMLYK